MKNYIPYFLLCFSLFFTSCEEVVEIDLKTGPEKLVIDANIYFDSEKPNQNQTIKLSKTVGFYANNYNPQLGAQVWIDDTLGNHFEFIDIDQNGNYKNEAFVMNINTSYKLHVITEGQSYTSEAVFYNTPAITKIEQKSDGGLLGDSYEFKFWFKDNVDQENYYQLIDYAKKERRKEFSVMNDTYSNGNLMNFLIIDSDLKIGEIFNISFSETSKSYYLYMEKILSTSQGASNPFA